MDPGWGEGGQPERTHALHLVDPVTIGFVLWTTTHPR